LQESALRVSFALLVCPLSFLKAEIGESHDAVIQMTMMPARHSASWPHVKF